MADFCAGADGAIDWLHFSKDVQQVIRCCMQNSRSSRGAIAFDKQKSDAELVPAEKSKASLQVVVGGSARTIFSIASFPS